MQALQMHAALWQHCMCLLCVRWKWRCANGCTTIVNVARTRGSRSCCYNNVAVWTTSRSVPLQKTHELHPAFSFAVGVSPKLSFPYGSKYVKLSGVWLPHMTRNVHFISELRHKVQLQWPVANTAVRLPLYQCCESSKKNISCLNIL